jgi:hypothetical protein
MKIEARIRAKIAEHEKHINEILEMNRAEWTDFFVLRIELYLMGRKALQWVLSEESSIVIDAYEKQVKWECICFDSTKIF